MNSFTRRHFVRSASFAAAALATRRAPGAGDADAKTVTLPFDNGERPLAVYPQKRALIVQTTRPPQLETPFSVFNEGIITPNDAFFVRYHLANIPTSIDPATYQLQVKGHVKTPLNLSLETLRKEFDPVELVAVNQCSGNSRGFFSPRVGGGQLGNGAMGNARWKGARLKDVLERAGVQAGARQVAANGLDAPLLPQTPDFVKALEIDHALDGEVMLAYEMNGEPLPMLNGFPLRLVVPGYYGTYWVKHLSELTVLADVLDNFWMSTAYRIPTTPNASIPPGTTPAKTVPIARYNVRSFITNFAGGETLPQNQPVEIRGIAFDGGGGIREVLVSLDGGATWRESELDAELSRYSFRGWKLSLRELPARGDVEIKCRAINRAGETQPLEPGWNPSGYMRNVVDSVRVKVS